MMAHLFLDASIDKGEGALIKKSNIDENVIIFHEFSFFFHVFQMSMEFLRLFVNQI